VTQSDQGLRAIFFDLGDTLMIEESEVKDDTATTLRAELLPGAAALIHELHSRGVPLALVADSRPNTPPNVLQQHDILDLFDYLAVSEVIGATKPDPRIFEAALDALGIAPEEYGRVVMVGNHLERDIAGANRLGIISIFIHWNERRRTTPEATDELPNHTVRSIEELRVLLSRLLDAVQEGPDQ
jgi:HAD superfamily hydrolase (TIGR01509 family)